MSEVPIERLAAELRRLRLRLDGYRSPAAWPTKDAEWKADLNAYDDALVHAATVLGLDEVTGDELLTGFSPPENGRGRLRPEVRFLFEEALARAGMDVRGRWV